MGGIKLMHTKNICYDGIDFTVDRYFCWQDITWGYFVVILLVYIDLSQN